MSMAVALRRIGRVLAAATMAVCALIFGAEPAPGPFTSEQSAEGRKLYQAMCASCHGAGLEGHGDTPQLAGKYFVRQWRDRSVQDLLGYIRTTMPPRSQGNLTGEAAAGIGVPAGIERGHGGQPALDSGYQRDDPAPFIRRRTEGDIYSFRGRPMKRIDASPGAAHHALLCAVGLSAQTPAAPGTLTPAALAARAKAQNVPEIPYDSGATSSRCRPISISAKASAWPPIPRATSLSTRAARRRACSSSSRR